MILEISTLEDFMKEVRASDDIRSVLVWTQTDVRIHITAKKRDHIVFVQESGFDAVTGEKRLKEAEEIMKKKGLKPKRGRWSP